MKTLQGKLAALSPQQITALGIATTAVGLVVAPVAVPLVGVGIGIGGWILARSIGKKGEKNAGIQQVLAVEKSRISLFQLPPGHPRDNVVYAGHPLVPNRYVPLADFHRLTFEHKFSEAVSLLMHLGAKAIRVEQITGWGKEFSARLRVTLPVTPFETKGGVSGGSDQESQQSVLFHAILDNKHPPNLPANLVWYQFEPTWQEIANARQKFGLKQFTLALNYKEDFGINAGLKLKLGETGLDIGGTFEEMKNTTWNISGHF